MPDKSSEILIETASAGSRKRFSLYMDRAQYDELQERAGKQQLRMASYLRLLLGHAVTAAVTPADTAEALMELREVGIVLHDLLEIEEKRGGMDRERLREALERSRAAEKKLLETVDRKWAES